MNASMKPEMPIVLRLFTRIHYHVAPAATHLALPYRSTRIPVEGGHVPCPRYDNLVDGLGVAVQLVMFLHQIHDVVTIVIFTYSTVLLVTVLDFCDTCPPTTTKPWKHTLCLVRTVLVHFINSKV